MSMDSHPMEQPRLCLIHNYWTKMFMHFVVHYKEVHSEFGHMPDALLVSSASRMLDSGNWGS